MRQATKVTETESLFETLANKSPVGICIIQGGKFCYINPTFQSNTGYREDEVLGRDSLEIVFPEDRERVRENAIKMLKGKLTLPYQFRVNHKDGSIHWVIESVASVQYRGRQATLGSFVDITERKQAEEALQAERNKLQSLTDALEYTVTIQDTEYNIIYQNEPSRIASGGAHVGEKCYRAYEGRDTVCDGCPVEKAFKDGKSHTTERRTAIVGKTAFWENTASPIRDAEGRIVACLELARDITERKQAEEQLQESEQYLKTLFNASAGGILIIDPKTHEIVDANSTVIKMIGIERDQIIGRMCHKFVCSAEVGKCPITDLGQKVDSSERILLKANGESMPIIKSVVPITRQGRQYLLELIVDITEHKQQEQMLQAERNKLQSLIDALEYTLTIQDTEYNIVYQNEPSKIAYGDHLGEKCYRVYEGRESICEDCPVEKAFKDDKPHTSERQRVMPSGEVAFWEHTASPIRDAKGRVISCLALGRNITERKKQEQALADEATRRRLLIDQSLDGIVVLDVDARVVEANQRFAEMLGYTLEEVRELHTWDWDKNFPPEKILEMGRNADEKGLHLETKHTRKDGSVIDVDISINAAMVAGQKLIFCVCRDVTARNQAEETLQAERSKLQSLIDAMEDGINIIDTKYNLIYQNEPARRRTGGDHAGEKCYRAYEGKEMVCDGCPVEKAFKDGKSHTAERSTILPSGEVAFWENTANPIRDAEGKIVSCLELSRDITARKKAQEALQTEKNKLQSLIDAMTDGLSIQDTEYNIIFQNEPSSKTTAGDRTGEKCYRVFEGQEKVCDGCPVEKAFKDGKPHIAERQRILPSGETTFWENMANPIRDAKGRVVACLEIGRNITERKRAEEALNIQRAYFQQLFDTSPDAIIMMDTNDRAIQVNKGFEKLFGYSNEEVKGQSLIELIVPEEGAQEASNSFQKILSGEVVRKERVRRRKDGSLVDVSILAYPIRSNGELVGLYGVYSDITERKKQEQALADELTRRRLLVDQSLDGIVVIDENDKVYEANQRFAEMLGYTLEEVHELHTWDWDKNFSPEQIHELGRKADEKGFLLETTHTRKDGSVIDVDISINASMFGGQKLIFCVCRDVTERKKAEQALADELAQRRLLINQSLDGIVVLDVDARVVEANQRFAEMLGYTLEEVRELHTWDWDKNFPPEKILEMGRNADEKGFHLETKHTRKDGSVIDVDISISAIMYGGQKLIFCIQRDVTERNKMAEALKLAAEEWRRTFDSISDAISIHNRDFQILRANKAFADIFQVGLDQIIGKHCYELHKGKKPRTSCPQQQTLATGKPAVAEFYESHLGKYFLESTSPIFDEKGEIVGTVHVTRDITEQKQQNERLTMADRLASIGELAAGTAHELNNPLTSVIGFSQLLMEKDIPDDIREDVTFIYDEAQRAANVTKNLLTFARKHTTVKNLNQINNIIEDVLKLRAYEHKVNSIEVKKRLAPDLPEIMVDYFQMQQVFLNIIINAEYFMTEAHNRGTLTITTKKQNGSVRISFADDGPGIPRENLNRIFDPFFTTKEPGKGTGLGLSICHGIVTEHSGQIYARSQLGKGATIIIELPIKSS